MGTWKLEVGKMAVYMSFPVLLFHYFNQPEYFENWVTTVKRDIFPPEDPSQREFVQKAIQEMRKKHSEKMFAAMENHSD